jgi:hypothetical protein
LYRIHHHHHLSNRTTMKVLLLWTWRVNTSREKTLKLGYIIVSFRIWPPPHNRRWWLMRANVRAFK